MRWPDAFSCQRVVPDCMRSSVPPSPLLSCSAVAAWPNQTPFVPPLPFARRRALEPAATRLITSLLPAPSFTRSDSPSAEADVPTPEPMPTQVYDDATPVGLNRKPVALVRLPLASVPRTAFAVAEPIASPMATPATVDTSPCPVLWSPAVMSFRLVRDDDQHDRQRQPHRHAGEPLEQPLARRADAAAEVGSRLAELLLKRLGLGRRVERVVDGLAVRERGVPQPDDERPRDHLPRPAGLEHLRWREAAEDGLELRGVCLARRANRRASRRRGEVEVLVTGQERVDLRGRRAHVGDILAH